VDWRSARENFVVAILDIVSAFIHALEQNPNVFMRPPLEWYKANKIEVGTMVWHMLHNLYGRKSAGATFRDFWESVVCSTPKAEIVRLENEPCMYYSEKTKVQLVHHVDDARLTGPEDAQRQVTAHLSRFMLMELSEPVKEGLAYKYLGNSKIGIARGWITKPDPAHVRGVAARLGLDTIGKAAVTPGVKRAKVVPDEDDGHYGSSTEFRSCVGCLIHATKEIEVIASPMKELSRKLSNPGQEDWQDLSRLIRYMHGKEDWGTRQVVSENLEEGLATVTVTTDANWACDESGRATLAIRAHIDGYKSGHMSQTQPGLPALSSGESEMRAMTTGTVVGLHVKMILEELGYKVKLVLECDASAALEAAAKMSSGRMRHMAAADTFVRKLLKSKEAVAKKIPTKANVAGLLSKHVSKETLEALLPLTGWGPVTEPYRLVELVKVNDIKDLADAGELELEGKAKVVKAVRSEGKNLAKAVLCGSACGPMASQAVQGYGGWFVIVVAVTCFGLGIYGGSLATRACRTVRSRDVGSQAPTTYTWRNAVPRFSVLPDRSHG